MTNDQRQQGQPRAATRGTDAALSAHRVAAGNDPVLVRQRAAYAEAKTLRASSTACCRNSGATPEAPRVPLNGAPGGATRAGQRVSPSRCSETRAKWSRIASTAASVSRARSAATIAR